MTTTRYDNHTQQTSLQQRQIYKTKDNPNVQKTKKGYITYATWNCYRGLLNTDNQQTSKMMEMEEYMNCNKIDVLVINEADIYGKEARIKRRTPSQKK